MLNAILKNILLVKVKVLNETLIWICRYMSKEGKTKIVLVSNTSQLYIFNSI